MMGFGFDGGILSSVLWGLSLLLHMALPIIIIVGSVWLVVDIWNRKKSKQLVFQKTDPFQILKERYARGELNEEQYFKMKTDLTNG